VKHTSCEASHYATFELLNTYLYTCKIQYVLKKLKTFFGRDVAWGETYILYAGHASHMPCRSRNSYLIIYFPTFPTTLLLKLR